MYLLRLQEELEALEKEQEEEKDENDLEAPELRMDNERDGSSDDQLDSSEDEASYDKDNRFI